MKVVVRESPNQSARVHGDDSVRLVVCHTPEGGYEGTVAFILRESAKVSYHELIKKDGTEITRLVPWKRKAWHAGALNSLSDGISIEGHASHFDLGDKGVFVMAEEVARRLIARGLQPNWTTDPAKGGFCRHGDLQADRTDPTPDMAEWRLFAGMVKEAYAKLRGGPLKRGKLPGPSPKPPWFWQWMRWKDGHLAKRPADAPRLILPWAWLARRQMQRNRKQ
jgi:hypothetical protein